MNEEIKEKTVILPPFKHFIMTVGAIPTSYLESMTYYEMLVWFTNYLGKTVIPAINENGEAVTELQNLFRELQDYVNNYFDNLDVQEEINNKLDDMVEQGTLQEIIADYLNSKAIFGFDNVESMKEATNLIDGSYARTLGYYTKNDGGSALYKIRKITNDDVVDNMFIIPMDSSDELIAELVITSNVNVDVLGAKGNGIDDDTAILQAGITYCINNKKTLISSGNKTYLISDKLNINGIVNIDFNNSSIITNSAIKMIDINHDNLRKGGFIKNIVINMNSVATHGIYCTIGTKQLISNIEIINISNIGFELNDGIELIFENSHLRGSTSSNTSIGLKLNRGDSHYKDIILIDCHTAIVNKSANFFERIHAWILTPSLIKDSIFMEFSGTRSFLSQCYSDTYNIAFKIKTDGRLRLVEHNNYYNPDILTPEIISTFTNGVVYMFLYDNDSHTRQTTITNSYLQGYSNNNTLAYFTNVSNNNNRMFIDSQTRIINWYDNFKTLNIVVPTISSPYLNLYTNGKIRSINNITSLSLILTNPEQISANSTISNIYTLENLLRPLQQELFIAPVTIDASYSTITSYCMVWINTDGSVNLSTPVNIPANSYIYISRSFISNRDN